MNFQHHQSLVSHGPSEIILICGFDVDFIIIEIESSKAFF